MDAGPEAWREMSASERNDRVRIPSLPSLKRVRRPVPSCVDGNETHCCDDDRRSRPTVHSTLTGRSIGAEQFTSRRPSDLGIMQAVITFDLDPADGYTRVYQTYDFEVLPRFKPLGWVLERLIVRWMIKRGVNRTIRDLVRVVEEERRRPIPPPPSTFRHDDYGESAGRSHRRPHHREEGSVDWVSD